MADTGGGKSLLRAPNGANNSGNTAGGWLEETFKMERAALIHEFNGRRDFLRMLSANCQADYQRCEHLSGAITGLLEALELEAPHNYRPSGEGAAAEVQQREVKDKASDLYWAILLKHDFARHWREHSSNKPLVEAFTSFLEALRVVKTIDEPQGLRDEGSASFRQLKDLLGKVWSEFIPADALAEAVSNKAPLQTRLGFLYNLLHRITPEHVTPAVGPRNTGNTALFANLVELRRALDESAVEIFQPASIGAAIRLGFAESPIGLSLLGQAIAARQDKAAMGTLDQEELQLRQRLYKLALEPDLCSDEDRKQLVSTGFRRVLQALERMTLVEPKSGDIEGKQTLPLTEEEIRERYLKIRSVALRSIFPQEISNLMRFETAQRVKEELHQASNALWRELGEPRCDWPIVTDRDKLSELTIRLSLISESCESPQINPKLLLEVFPTLLTGTEADPLLELLDAGRLLEIGKVLGHLPSNLAETELDGVRKWFSGSNSQGLRWQRELQEISALLQLALPNQSPVNLIKVLIGEAFAEATSTEVTAAISRLRLGLSRTTTNTALAVLGAGGAAHGGPTDGGPTGQSLNAIRTRISALVKDLKDHREIMPNSRLLFLNGEQI